MKIFLSWSGDLSHDIALALREWLPRVIHPLRPFFTPSDIEKGARWLACLSTELENSAFGIFCLTPDNLEKPWLQFEAGALSKHVDAARVCPVLFGVEPADVVGPLEQFQLVRFTEREIAKLVQQLNLALGEHRLEDAILTDSFEHLWPRLNSRVGQILQDNAAKATLRIAKRTERELLEEALVLLNTLASNRSETGIVRADGTGAAAVVHALASLLDLSRDHVHFGGDSEKLLDNARNIYSPLKFLFEGNEFPRAYESQIRKLLVELESTFKRQTSREATSSAIEAPLAGGDADGTANS